MEPQIPSDWHDRGMEIDVNRGRRVRGTVMYWGSIIVIGSILALLLYRFTGSLLLALLFAGGMLAYMLVMSALTSRSLSRPPGEGRLD
jgi:hypothetical protein